MNKNIGILTSIIIVIIIIIIGWILLSRNKLETNPVADSISEAQNQAVVNEIQMRDTARQEAAAKKVGSYLTYSPDKLTMAETGNLVLFFYASWCPSCRALNSDIDNNLEAIPSGVTILKTDYDKETELKKKYSVTTQHTLVQVDKDGNLIKKWSGGSKLDNLLSQIQ